MLHIVDDASLGEVDFYLKETYCCSTTASYLPKKARDQKI